MKRHLLAVSMLSCALAGFGGATANASAPESGNHLTQSQLKQLTKTASTPAQYGELAGYYNEQQKTYAGRAADEKAEWIRRSQFTSSIEAKYPRPVDTAKSLYDYYTLKATEAAGLSTKYGQLAASKAQ